MIKEFLASKKAQLGIIEMKFFIYGLIVGIVLGIALIYLGNTGTLPFKIPAGCPVLGK